MQAIGQRDRVPVSWPLAGNLTFLAAKARSFAKSLEPHLPTPSMMCRLDCADEGQAPRIAVASECRFMQFARQHIDAVANGAALPRSFAPPDFGREMQIETMALAFAEIDGAIKGNENAAFKQGGKVSRYADINAVIDAIKPALINHGLFFTQHPQPHDRGVQIETFLHHANGESVSLGVLFVPASKQDAQGFGSALTYARRYALVTAFGVPVEDDDGNAAAAASKKEREAPKEPVITHEQVTELMLLIPAAQMTPAKFNQSYNIKDVPQLPASKFDEAKDRLQTRMAALAKKATEEQAKEPA